MPLPLFLPKLFGTVSKLVNKGKQVRSQFAPPKPAPRPAPKPAPRKPAPPKVAKKPPVAVLPPAPRPVVLPKPTPDTVNVLGMKVPKPLAYVGGTALGIAAVVGIAKAVR